MRFRPCIDIHNGKVKQIVGGSLSDAGDSAKDNFVSNSDADYYAGLYREKGLSGGHVIILNPKDSPYYAEDLRQAELALKAYPGGLMIGGGINDENAAGFLDMGASHVIVTSYVFRDGRVDYERLEKLISVTGSSRLVLDLSCRRRGDSYYIVTDRWQKFTEVRVDAASLKELSAYCAEFLVHAVDVEGKAAGIDAELAGILSSYDGIPITYAGGVGSFEDLKSLKEAGRDKLDVTVGSALSIFGGQLDFDEVVSLYGRNDRNQTPAFM